MNNKDNIRILIACEESQTVCLAFRKRGFQAFSCDIQPCSGGHTEWHFLGDCFDVINNGGGMLENGKDFFIEKNWDVIIAHPPCTYLSNAGVMHLIRNNICYIDRYKKGIEAKAFFMKFFTVNCKHLAVENPVSIKIFNMPKHSQTIQPYFFGHTLAKTTRLWLKNLPPLIPTVISEKYINCEHSKFYNYGGKERQKKRSKTFPGIAEAMAEQWGNFIIQKRIV